MKNKKIRKLLIIYLIVVVLIVGAPLSAHYNFGARIWYLIPSFKDYYVFIPTDLSESEASKATVTLTNVTGFGEKTIVAEYWEENNCFHAVVSSRGIYEINMDTPEQSAQTKYVEINQDEIYCIPFNKLR